MGTFTSIFPEVKREGTWRFAGRMVPNVFEGEKMPGPDLVPEWIFGGRNLAVDAILGWPNGSRRLTKCFERITDMNGLPEDVSPELRAYFDDEDVCGWVLLSELQNVDWNKDVIRAGMVSKKAAHLFPTGRRGFPAKEEWPEDVMHGYAAMTYLGVVVKWIETLAEAVGEEFMDCANNTLPALGEPDDVRMVYGICLL